MSVSWSLAMAWLWRDEIEILTSVIDKDIYSTVAILHDFESRIYRIVGANINTDFFDCAGRRGVLCT